jgi:hypothetical protein
VWSVLRISDGDLGAEDLDSLMVGRREELHRLRAALEDACSDSARLVTIVGPAGREKSRLVSVLHASSDSCGRWWVCRYGFGCERRCATSVLRLKEVFPDEDVGGWVEGTFIAFSASAGGEPAGDRRAEVFAVWRRLLEAVAARAARALVFEDMHPAGQAMLDLIDDLSTRLGRRQHAVWSLTQEGYKLSCSTDRGSTLVGVDLTAPASYSPDGVVRIQAARNRLVLRAIDRDPGDQVPQLLHLLAAAGYGGGAFEDEEESVPISRSLRISAPAGNVWRPSAAVTAGHVEATWSII